MPVSSKVYPKVWLSRKKAGLDAKLVVDCISKGAAGSWQMENRGKTMADDEFDFGFAVEWMRKDLGIALEEAKSNGAMLPVTAVVDQFYAEVIAMGGKRWDTSSLIRRLYAQVIKTPLILSGEGTRQHNRHLRVRGDDDVCFFKKTKPTIY